MPIISILFGLVLIVLGLDGYLDLIGVVRPAEQAPTSLIPAHLGAFLVFCGLLAVNPRFLKHAIALAKHHAAVEHRISALTRHRISAFAKHKIRLAHHR